MAILYLLGSGSRLSTPPNTVGRGDSGGARTPSPTAPPVRHSIEPPHYGVPKNIPVTSSQGNLFYHMKCWNCYIIARKK